MKTCVIIAIASLAFVEVQGFADMNSYLLLDDFGTDSSTLDTEWEGFTDRVMGGVSDMNILRVPEDDGFYVRMRGKVSLENNGGFIQIRLKLASSLAPFDGSRYQGIRITARGVGEGYYVFLRTSDTVFPWKYFAAPIPVSDDWQVVDIPWSAFRPGDYGRGGRFRINKLRSLAIVAYGREFDAEIDVKEIGMY